tara:strand:+ start:4324 stop:6819 length:2496 start_codon:yes stop_codon:yes gene_type:complete
MAERIVSPGVFTQENDLSFLPVGIGEIGAAIIGNTQKGVAFEPQVIRSFNEFQDQFGAGTDGTYVPYTVKEYIKHAGAVTIVRTLGLAGYTATTSGIAFTALSESAAAGVTASAYIVGILHPTSLDDDAVVTSNAGLAQFSHSAQNFFSGNVSASITSTGGTANITFSFDEENSDYLVNCLGQDSGRYVPTAGNSALNTHYVYSVFNSASIQQHLSMQSSDHSGYIDGKASTANAILNKTIGYAQSASVFTFDSTGVDNPMGAAGYSHAATPWVRSQNINNATQKLFKIHTLGHGTVVNDDFKVSISNIKHAGATKGDDYGSFTLQIRKGNDSDTRPIALESYANVSLDPNNPNYIGRRIGTQYRSYDSSGKLVVNGFYPNISKYIRVEMNTAVDNRVASVKVVPFGHDAYVSPFAISVKSTGLNSTTAYYPPVALITSKSNDNSKLFFGFNFDAVEAKGNVYYQAPLMDSSAVGHNSAFKLEDCTDYNTATNKVHPTGSALKYKKFSMAFQGGFDGVNPATQVATGLDLLGTNTFGHDVSTATSTGYDIYKKALNAVANPDEIDINLIVTPGILNSNATAIIAKAIEICEDRGDCFYIFDPNNSLAGDSITNATTQANSYDTNYAAMYYPWVKILDAATNRFKFVPPSVVIPGVYAFNDKVAHPWFAPAGLNRGSLTTVVDVYTRLTHSERDALYEGRINPIAVFPRTGVCVWGQKTLQAKPSALDRINVRRLLIAAKKFIASATKYLVFENNTTATRQRFLNIVNPYLESVQQNQGLYAFRVVMDETNNTPDVIDRNQMKGEIFLQPAKAAEFIIIDFNIMPTGASFDE